jgi:aminoacyl tRNA synthase complex-interacting multifunctional protein 2
MVSPTQQTCIEGEANIARFLARLLQPAYDSLDLAASTQIDDILDVVQQQVIQGNNKERAAALRTLNARLGKSPWLVGSSSSLADIVAWSALTSSGAAQDAPGNVAKWLKTCQQSDVFRSAVEFMS